MEISVWVGSFTSTDLSSKSSGWGVSQCSTICIRCQSISSKTERVQSKSTEIIFYSVTVPSVLETWSETHYASLIVFESLSMIPYSFLYSACNAHTAKWLVPLIKMELGILWWHQRMLVLRQKHLCIFYSQLKHPFLYSIPWKQCAPTSYPVESNQLESLHEGRNGSQFLRITLSMNIAGMTRWGSLSSLRLSSIKCCQNHQFDSG